MINAFVIAICHRQGDEKENMISPTNMAHLFFPGSAGDRMRAEKRVPLMPYTGDSSGGQIVDTFRYQPKAPPYLCTECGKRFSRPSHLQIHQRVHSGLRPYVCKICNRSFSQKGNLKSHLVTHRYA